MSELQKLQEVTAALRQQLDVANLQNGRYHAALEEIVNTTPGGTSAWRIADRTINGVSEKQNCDVCHETVKFDGGPIYCYQPLPCRIHG